MHKIANRIIFFESLNSTNDYLISLYKEWNLRSNFVVMADRQYNGRGRRKKKWFSDKDSLTFSFSIELELNMNSWHLSMTVSLALVRLLSDYNIQAVIKYPNDIFFKKNKIAGILTEVISVKNRKYCIVGIGLNVNNKSFPVSLSNVTSIKKIISGSINKDSLFSGFFKHVDLIMNHDNLINDYVTYLYGFKKLIPCLYRGSFLRIKILSVDNNGFLQILTENSSIKTVRYENIRFLIN